MIAIAATGATLTVPLLLVLILAVLSIVLPDSEGDQ